MAAAFSAEQQRQECGGTHGGEHEHEVEATVRASAQGPGVRQGHRLSPGRRPVSILSRVSGVPETAHMCDNLLGGRKGLSI